MRKKDPESSGDGRNATGEVQYRLVYSSVIRSGESIRGAGIDPTPALFEAIASYCELLLRWNRKINLTAITDPRELVERNFVESFFGAKWLAPGGGVLCDVGSGAGFPGLALKLVRRNWEVRLFEPNLKKATFLAEVARELNLSGVEVLRQRWGESIVPPNSVDVVTARAVGGYEEIAQNALLAMRPGGRLLLWLGREVGGRLERVSPWEWKSEPLPGSRLRILLAGEAPALGQR